MKETIKITSGAIPTSSAKFLRNDGTEIDGVTACDIRMRIGEALTAMLCLRIDNIDVEAEPLLSFDTVCEAARYYGYDLIPIQEDKKKR